MISYGSLEVGDQEGVCQLITLYILIGSWIMPILREDDEFFTVDFD
jgi:hypothetical protein